MPYFRYQPTRQVNLRGTYEPMRFEVPYSSEPMTGQKYVSTAIQQSGPAGVAGEVRPVTWTEGPYGLGADPAPGGNPAPFDLMKWLNTPGAGGISYGMYAAGAVILLLVMENSGHRR